MIKQPYKVSRNCLKKSGAIFFQSISNTTRIDGCTFELYCDIGFSQFYQFASLMAVISLIFLGDLFPVGLFLGEPDLRGDPDFLQDLVREDLCERWPAAEKPFDKCGLQKLDQCVLLSSLGSICDLKNGISNASFMVLETSSLTLNLFPGSFLSTNGVS